MARRIRILVYEGPEEWLETTLSNKNRYVQGDRLFEFNDAARARSIKEAILPAEADDEASLNSIVLAAFDLVRGERSPQAVQAIIDKDREARMLIDDEDQMEWESRQEEYHF